MIKTSKKTYKIKVDSSLKGHYEKNKIFEDKYAWAVNHVKGRDLEMEIKQAIEKSDKSKAAPNQ